MPTSARWGRRGDLYGRPSCRKKALSSLVTGRKRLLSWCHPCSALEKRPLAFCCGKGTAPVSGPAGGAVSRPPAAGPSSQGTLLWCGGVSGTCSVIAVSALTILSRKGGKVNPFPRFPAIKRAARRAARLNHAVKGLVLGLMMSLQSRSPRAPPDGIHRAGTPVISDAAAGSEFRRPSAA